MTETVTNQNPEQRARLQILGNAANNFFPQITTGGKNSELLGRSIALPGLSCTITDRLKFVEESHQTIWEDKRIRMEILREEERGRIILPVDEVDRDRWAALLYMGFAEKEGFFYDSLLIPPDYLPDISDEFRNSESVYGKEALENIIKRRTFARSIGELVKLKKDAKGEGVPVVGEVVDLLRVGSIERARFYVGLESDKLHFYPKVVEKMEEVLGIEISRKYPRTR